MSDPMPGRRSRVGGTEARRSASSLAIFAATAVLAVLGSPASANAQDEQEVDCESVCRVFPDRAPPQCECEATITNPSSGGEAGADTYADPGVREIVEQMEEQWIEQTAGIEDYTLVVKSSIGGPPAIEYYEKEMVEGRPAFRRVSPAELSLREAEASGTDVGIDAAATMGQMLRGLAGAPDEDQDAAASEAQASGIGLPLETEQKNALRGLLLGAADFMEAGAEVRDSIHARDATAELEGVMFGAGPGYGEYARRLVRYGLGCIYGAPSATGELELVADRAGDMRDWWNGDECPEKDAFELLWDRCMIMGYSSSESALAAEPGAPNGVWLDADEVPTPETEPWITEAGDQVDDVREYICWESNGNPRKLYFSATVRSPGGAPMSVSAWQYDYNSRRAQFIPRRRGTRLSGLADGADFLVSGLGSMVTVFYRVLEVIVNSGPQTQQELAELLGKHMGEATAGG